MNKLKMKVSYDVENMVVVFSVHDEKQCLESKRVSFADLPSEGDIADRVSLYGLNKLLTDRTSDQKDKLVKLDDMSEVMDLLVSGEWSKERVVGAPVTGPEVEALAQLKELTVPQTQAALAAYDKETRKAILANKEVVELAAKIRAVRKDAEVANFDDMVPHKAA